MHRLLVMLAIVSTIAVASDLSGHVTDPQGKAVSGAVLQLFVPGAPIEVRTDGNGRYLIRNPPVGTYPLTVTASGFTPVTKSIQLPRPVELDLQFELIESHADSLVITAKPIEPAIDMRNAEVFNRTLFTRDDQVFQQLSAGIDAGQHEGGGKSLEIRRFGFNLDHGGVNGGLKVLVDDVQQNQGSQAHGQGYLGSLKALSPELIQEVTVVNGPFSAEYGDFSGLGVVHIRQRESLPDEFTARLQGGNFNNSRGFLAYSPNVRKMDSYAAYEGSYLDGPFINPGRYRRDNVNANSTKTLNQAQKLGFRLLFGRNDFYSSGQIPLDLVSSGRLDRFGYLDPTDGGRVKLGTASAYYSKSFSNGDTFRIDGFLGRSLFDLFSNFTYFLKDPVHGDAIQQHDSRLQEGANGQYLHPHKIGHASATFTSGINFHDNQIYVGLYPRQGRVPEGVETGAGIRVTNEAAYLQEQVSLWSGRLILGTGLRYDEFRYRVADRVNPGNGGLQYAGKWQAKGSAAFTLSPAIPLTLTFNYGRGINSVDARGVIERTDQPRLAATDFYQLGAASNHGRFGISTDLFLINHSNEQVYIADQGTYEFKGPTQAYGFETKASLELTRHLSLSGGITKIANAFYRGAGPRIYVDSAPHFVANAALTLAAWRGWSGSLRMGAINHYRLDGEDPSITASGHTVWDLGVTKRINRHVELNLSLDNLANRSYYETQNYFESRVAPDAPVVARIHATPAYPLSAVAGMTLRFGGK
jgi:outer membrane receptor protein involved in Fe transport